MPISPKMHCIEYMKTHQKSKKEKDKQKLERTIYEPPRNTYVSH